VILTERARQEAPSGPHLGVHPEFAHGLATVKIGWRSAVVMSLVEAGFTH
jgi:hypothetical protein